MWNEISMIENDKNEVNIKFPKKKLKWKISMHFILIYSSFDGGLDLLIFILT
jgi:hypothetical protein